MTTQHDHLSEEELIAYQLHESPDSVAIGRHLDHCMTCAATAESIAETLRVFSAEPVPQANLDHAWQRMRGSLPAVAAAPRAAWWSRRLVWLVPVGVLLLGFAAELHLHVSTGKGAPTFANDRQGPLTVQPASAMNAHLDSAERLLTEVNHASGPLDDSVRTQAHALALSNAVYVQQAHAQGDPAQVALLENLGRVLTTLDHEPPAEDKGWHLRFEMNTDGLLLDLRILQQNDQHGREDAR